MKIGIITMMFGVLVSCQSQEKGKHEPMNLIIKSSKDFVTEDGEHIDEEFGTTQEFEKHHLKVQFLEDTIYA